MKLVLRTLFFHILCIFSFAYIYFYLSDDFQHNKENNVRYKSLLDFFLLSITVQAGVGITDLFPTTYYSKIALIIQQFLMILTHIITLYIFTL